MFLKQRRLKKSVKIIRASWKNSPYYRDAEKWTHVFWDQNTVFKRLFDKLDLSCVVELAAGHGRHSEIVAQIAEKIIVMDVFLENIEVCRKRLRKFSNVTFRHCRGYAYDGVEASSVSSIFCYDAMVHFSPDIVEAYLKDSHRILTRGGRALFHHSNYKSTHKQHYGLNPHARNHMTKDLFSSLCVQAKLNVLESVVLNWGEIEALDCITLVEKR